MNISATNISDIRTEFKNITFSGFQKSVVKKELLKCIYNKKIENSCYWAGEYICAGHYSDLWDILILYMGKYVHIGNPKLPIYLHMRFEIFLSILKNGYNNNILSMRNNDKVRKLFCECICILCYSTKKHSIETIKIKSKEEFDMIQLSERLKAPTIEYAGQILKSDDSKELFIPINEFAYNLSIKNIIDVCYWFEWILEYENICKRKKIKIMGERRTYVPAEYQKDIIWIIWDTILLYSKATNNSLLDKIINALLQLFLIKYSESAKRKRKYIIYFAITLLLEPVNFNIEITENKIEIDAIVSKINSIFTQIKKNEIAPKTDYLFNGLERSNLDKTIEKLEIMEKL